MKTCIVMIKDMNCAHCQGKILDALQSEGIVCDVNLENKSVSIQGGNDVLAHAKRIIVEAGYTIM